MFEIRKYKIGFDVLGLLLFLIIMIPNFIWFAVPTSNDILRNKSITPVIDVIASIFQVITIISLCIIKNKQCPLDIPEGVEVVEGNLCSIDDVEKFFTVPEGTETICMHIASVVTVTPDYSPLVMNVNVGGTKNILHVMKKHPECKKLVYCSSTGAIPEEKKGRKMREVIYYDEDQTVGCYSRSKAIASQAVLDAANIEGLNACIVLPSGILGPEDPAIGETTGTVIEILKGAMPMGMDGSFNLCDVRDLAAGCIGAADFGKKGESYILANEEVSFRDFVKLICEESGCKPIKTFLPLSIAYKLAAMMEKSAKKILLMLILLKMN